LLPGESASEEREEWESSGEPAEPGEGAEVSARIPESDEEEETSNVRDGELRRRTPLITAEKLRSLHPPERPWIRIRFEGAPPVERPRNGMAIRRGKAVRMIVKRTQFRVELPGVLDPLPHDCL
jgi:hypothetical protein